MFDSTVPPAQPSRARRMLGRLALAALVMLASFIVASLPAAASHLKGGYITAKIDSTTNHITGRFTYINDDNDPLGQTDTFTINITPPAGQPDGPKTFNVTGEVVFTAPGTSVYAVQYDVDLTTVFPGGVPNGVYTLYYSNSATVNGIINGNPGGDTGLFYRAQVTKGPGQLGSPEITCDPPSSSPSDTTTSSTCSSPPSRARPSPTPSCWTPRPASSPATTCGRLRASSPSTSRETSPSTPPPRRATP